MAHPLMHEWKKSACLVLTAVMLFATCTQRAYAQADQATQLQQLQMKLEQMEKQMQELKQQISSMQPQPQPSQQPPAPPTKS